MEKELVVVIDFGGQYNQLIARRVRECNVYCEIYSYKTDMAKIMERRPKGIILTGGPSSCYEEGAATCSPELFEQGIPVLGLCYGAQLMTHVLGGEVTRAAAREYGKTEVDVDVTSRLFADVTPHGVLDEPFRLYRPHGPGLSGGGAYRQLSCGGRGVGGAGTLCHPVPPGGAPHCGGFQDAVQFRAAHLRLRGGLADGLLRGGEYQSHP